jgi:methionine-rich copper-binding protein CopC
MMRTRWIFSILVVTLGCMLLGVPGTPARAADFAYISIDPPDSATVSVSPAEVVLNFSAPVDPMLTGGYIHNLDNVIVSTGVRIDANDPAKIIISLTPNLPSGWYMIMWNTTPLGGDESIAGMQEFNVA